MSYLAVLQKKNSEKIVSNGAKKTKALLADYNKGEGKHHNLYIGGEIRLDKSVDHVFVIEAPAGEAKKLAILINCPKLYLDQGDGMAYHTGEVKVIYDGHKIETYEIEIKSIRMGE